MTMMGTESLRLLAEQQRCGDLLDYIEQLSFVRHLEVNGGCNIH